MAIGAGFGSGDRGKFAEQGVVGYGLMTMHMRADNPWYTFSRKMIMVLVDFKVFDQNLGGEERKMRSRLM